MENTLKKSWIIKPSAKIQTQTMLQLVWFRESGALKNASSKLESHSEKRENWLLRVINDLIQDGAELKYLRWSNG